MKPIKQRDWSDCGPACLAAVTSHYGRRLSVAQLRQLSGTNQNGTTVLGLVQASTQLGFSAKAVKARPDHLLKAPLPAIAHVIVREQRLHYVVVFKLKKDRVMVMDPATGRLSTQSWPEFQRQWTGVLILLAPGGAFERGDGRPGRLAWYLRLLKPHRPALVQALLGATLATLLALSGSFYLQKVVDAVIVESNVPLLNLLTVAMLAALGVQTLLTAGQNLILVKAGLKLDLALILSYYRHLFTLPQSFFEGMRVGEMVSRINDAVKIRAFLSQQGASLIVSALTLVLAVLITWAFSWTLALMALAFLALYSLWFLFAALQSGTISRRLLEQTADFEAQVVESLEMASTLRRFDRQWVAEMKAEALFVQMLKTAYTAGRFSIAARSAGNVMVQGFTIALLWLGATAVIQTQLSPGQLLSCFALAGYLTGPASNLLAFLGSASEVQVAADRLFELLALEGEGQAGTLELTDIKPLEIRLEKVSFAYPGQRPILKQVDACFREGEMTLLRGESGCGKSSLLSLLQGFYPPGEGRICFGSYELPYVRLSSLRTQISTVPQKVELMGATVIENITLCDFEPDLQKAFTICDRLGLLEFIRSLPAGFDTRLAENGKNLSGGQRQLLAIARALYVEAPVYLFDEPTSALDEEAERRVLRALHELRDSGKIVLLVAHDSRFIAVADQVYTVKNGSLERTPAATRREPPPVAFAEKG
jgi:ATP-binding cassette subfamily B protein